MPPKSELWRYFDKLKDGKASCRICKKILKTCGNTSNLRCHINSVHKMVLEDETRKIKTASSFEEVEPSFKKRKIEGGDKVEGKITDSEITQIPSCSSSDNSYQTKQLTIDTSIKRIVSYGEGGSKHSQITNTICYMIAKDCQPFTIVENKGFKKLMKLTSPLYKMPTANTFKKQIEQKYNFVSAAVKRKLELLKAYCLTSDIWTETMQTLSYLGFTIHYVDMEDHELKSMMLGVYELNERHTAEYIAEKLENLCTEWNLKKDYITTIVTDGGPNMVKASEIFVTKKKHLVCFAHTLNLVVERSIQNTQDLKELINKVKQIVTWFKHSVRASDELRTLTSYKLIQEVSTRWNSTYYMLERFLNLRGSISNIINKNISAPLMLTALECDYIGEILNLLRPLEAITKEISGDKYPTCSMIIPLINVLNMQMAKIKPQYSISENLKKNILAECQKRFSNAAHNTTMAVSTLLDPRFKKLHFQDAQALAKAIIALKEEYKSISNIVNLDESDESSDSDHTSEFNLWQDHHKLLKENWIKSKQKTNDADGKLPEISLYFQTPPTGRIGDNPLHIWKELASSHPNMAQLITKYFCNVGTSVPSERLFSKTGIIINQQRNRLKPKTLNQLLFLQCVEDKYWGLD
ncbi:E3 SUMO-protein ligase ZBED1-like [Diabrotica undecimpunctata]|uniref:E3 SUMO-protein ligase ZBED1-like n=1 Tax=Diabrotica undecimpunctata TaxID=50387 RepID=UPI003B632D85